MFICDECKRKCLDCPIINKPGQREHMTEVIEVVRCKDCKHFGRYGYKPVGMKSVWCAINGLTFGEDDYCSHGERK